MQCRINTDMWSDFGAVYTVKAVTPRENSTAVTLKIEDSRGVVYERVVASHQIEWLDER